MPAGLSICPPEGVAEEATWTDGVGVGELVAVIVGVGVGVDGIVAEADADGVAEGLTLGDALTAGDMEANAPTVAESGDAEGDADGVAAGTAAEADGLDDARTTAELPKLSVWVANSTATATMTRPSATKPIRTSRPRSLRLRKFSYLLGLYRSLYNSASTYTTHSIAPAENLEKELFSTHSGYPIGQPLCVFTK